MENTDVIGGVSPLKARGKRGGKAARANTRTAKSRGGHAKTTKSSSSSNKGGYGALTRFKSRETWKKPASSGPSTSNTAPPFSNGLPNPAATNIYLGDTNVNNTNTNTMTQSQKQQQQQALAKAQDNPGTYTPPEYLEKKVEVPAKTGNDFADNCYEADGSKKHGHVYTSKKGKQILCKWGGKGGSGTHDYITPSSTKTERVLITPANHTPGSKSSGPNVKLSQEQY